MGEKFVVVEDVKLRDAVVVDKSSNRWSELEGEISKKGIDSGNGVWFEMKVTTPGKNFGSRVRVKASALKMKGK